MQGKSPKKMKAAAAESSDEDDEFTDGNKKDAAKAAKQKQYPGEDGQEYDDVFSQIFEKIPPGEGDEFGAVKPWLGAIKEPKNHPKPNKKAPAEDYAIDWIYGYRSEEARMNCQFNSLGQAVYPTAAVGVIFDYNKMKQSYFGGGKTDFGGRKQKDTGKNGHNDDVTALCMSFSRKMVASGQNGQMPTIYLWNSETAQLQYKKKLGKGCRLVTAIGISATDKYVCATDAAEKIAAHIFKVDGGETAIMTCDINMKVVHLAWSPIKEDVFATAGKDHVMICSLLKDKVDKKKGKTKGGKIESQCSVAWIDDSKFAQDCLTGGSDGQVYHWSGDALVKSYENNKGSVHSVACRKDESGKQIVLVGGNDKTLTVYSFDGKLSKLWSAEVDGAPRSLDLYQSNILMGLKNGSICVMPYEASAAGKAKVVMKSHCDGEVWGLDVVEFDNGEVRIITSADDNRCLIYNAKTRKAIAEGNVNTMLGLDPNKKKKEKKGYRGGASSMSSAPAEWQSRSVAFCPALNHLAIANNKGIVAVREVDWASIDGGKGKSALSTPPFAILFKNIKKAEWIETMVFSPDNNYLAVGSHDNVIYVVDTKSYKKVTQLKGHSSFITALDWSIDSKFLRSVCGAYELLFFNMEKKKRDPSGASNTIETVWVDQTTKLGWSVQGIFPDGCDGSHINSVAMTKDQKLIASGDDYGLVCVYRNPLLEKHESNKYRGHSEHVTSVKFTSDSQYLFSTGGQDQTTIQWKKIK